MAPPLHHHVRRLLAWFYLLDLGLAFVFVGAYKAPLDGRSLLATRAGTVLGVGVVLILVALGVMVEQRRGAGARGRRALRVAAATNLGLVLLILVVAESTLRIVARNTSEGLRIGSVLVRPSWDELVARSRGVLSGTTDWDYWDASYFVPDPQLGWTVGADRASGDGLYFSSVEGIRSGRPQVRMADASPRYRVALLGDSNAFSSEVPFDESWAQHLQGVLDGDVQVLNFGVDGYGIDQMLLRYEKDVRPWGVDVVVVGFIGHDLRRTMAVYPFVSFGWPGYLVKPRFAVQGNEPTLINLPLPDPAEILGAASVHELPFVEYDPGYRAADWAWRNSRLPLLLRYLTSRFPRWAVPDPVSSEDATEDLNALLLARLVGSIEADGAGALLVLLSDSSESLGLRAEATLSRAGLPFLSVTDCLGEMPANARWVASGIHFTGEANLAIARCTAPRVEQLLQERSRFGGEGR